LILGLRCRFWLLYSFSASFFSSAQRKHFQAVVQEARGLSRPALPFSQAEFRRIQFPEIRFSNSQCYFIQDWKVLLKSGKAETKLLSMNLPSAQSLLSDMNNVFSTRNGSNSFFQLPQLVVLQQNSLSEEKCAKNGGKTQQLVHVVVKNSPFVITLGLANNNAVRPDIFGKYMTNSGIDLGKLTFDCKLLYDTEGPDTEV